jgi:class 3 adenylate cyclase/tetratricopeptide (TPR) repeat protein
MTACPSCTHPADHQANYCSRCGFRFGGHPLAAPKGDRRVVTVLFADVSGFTALSEKLDPETVTDIVNQCFRSLTHPIYRFGGVVDKYIGDAIMAIFGAPISHEDDPVRAVNAAWAMQLAAERFADDLEAQVGMRIRLRIGLNTGLVVAGAVGGDQKRDYTVMGDAVNLAQRMEANAQPGSVLVAHETYRLTAHAFGYRSLSAIRVKGRQEPVPVYELTGPNDPKQVRLLPSRLVGRAHELEQLLAAWEGVQAGTPHWITLLGEAGIGKTHMVDEFQRRLGERAEFVTARGVSYHQDRAYGLVRHLLESWLRLPAEASSDEVHRAIATRLAGLRWAERDDIGLVALLTGHPGTDPPLSGTSDQQRLETAVETTLRALRDRARLVPTVLVVEDLHWVDQRSHEWLARLANALSTDPAPLLVVCQSRHGVALPELGASSGLQARQMALGPLDHAEARQLAEGLLADGELAPSLVDRAIARAEGNPMVLRELIRSYQEGAVPDAGISLSLKALVASRLDRLKPIERDLIEYAAVIGRVFDPSTIAHLAGIPDPQPLLLSLVGRDLIRPAHPDGYAFCQAIVHEVTYQGILHRKRRELHLAVGERLEALRGQDDGHAASLAYHFARAGGAKRALPYLCRSARAALRTFSHPEAESALTQALALLDADPSLGTESLKAELLGQLAAIALIQGGYATALRHLAEAIALSEPAGRSELRRLEGQVFERQGDYPAAMASYEAALGETDHPTARAGLMADRAWLWLRQGQRAEADADCHRALDEVRGLEHPRAWAARARAESLLGISAYRTNRWSVARAHHERALQLRERSGDLSGLAASLNNLGMVETELGAWKEANAHYVRSLSLYRRIGDPGHQASVLNNLGDLATRRGDLEAAEKHHRSALNLRRGLGDRFGTGASLCALGETLRQLGDREGAHAHLGAGLRELLAIGETELLAEAYEALARLCLATGQLDEARGWLEKGLDAATAASDRLRLSALERARCEWELARGDLAQAERALESAARSLKGLSSPLERARLLALTARVHHEAGRFSAATSAAQQACRLYESLGLASAPNGLSRSPRGQPGG